MASAVTNGGDPETPPLKTPTKKQRKKKKIKPKEDSLALLRLG